MSKAEMIRNQRHRETSWLGSPAGRHALPSQGNAAIAMIKKAHEAGY